MSRTFRSSVFFFGSAALICCAAPQTARAHNPDTSYARVRVTSDWLETKFTYDLDVLDRAFQLNRNRDATISRDEFLAAAPTIVRFLRKAVELEIDEYSADFGEAEPPGWPADAANSIGAGEWQSTLVHFPFRKRIQELPESVSLAFRVFDTVGDRHTILGTFHQPPHPEYEVVYTKFEPDFWFFTYDWQARGGSSQADGPEPEISDWELAWNQSTQFFKMGVQHILEGYDHLLFLLALIIVAPFRQLVKIVTSFTVAHSITLILAALNIVSLPTRFIESAIALTIVYVAIENLWVKDTRHRWLLTFCFGLVHGFGFANVLRELGLPTTGLVRSLVAFNIGVEAGQLAIVIPIWPLWRLLARQAYGVWLTRIVSIAISACGVAWFLDRAFNLGIMRF